MVAQQRKNQTVIEATGFAHQRREQALGNAQVTEQQVSAEMHAYGNISEALALGTAAGLDYIWWDSLHALAASGGDYGVSSRAKQPARANIPGRFGPARQGVLG